VLRRFDAVAAEGQQLEPENAYFDAMRSAGAFAAGRDAEALRYFRDAAAKADWNDYAGEETRAKWQLVRAAYGDRGAIQKLPFVFDLALPHFALIRNAAQMTLWHAQRRARAGDLAGARALHHEILRLGATIAERSPTNNGRLVGIGIFQSVTWRAPSWGAPAPGSTSAPRSPPTPEQEAREWRAQRERYAATLEASGDPGPAVWLRTTGDRLDAMHLRLRRGLSSGGDDLSILYTRLIVGWLYGLVVIWQLLAILALWAGAVLLGRALGKEARTARPPDAGTWGAIHLAVLAAPLILITPLWWSDLLGGGAGLLFYGSLVTGMFLAGTLALVQWRGQRARSRARGAAENPPPELREKQRPWHTVLVALVSVLPVAAWLWLLVKATHLPTGGVFASSGEFLLAAAFQALGRIMTRVYPFT
jgi:hypothetical protein